MVFLLHCAMVGYNISSNTNTHLLLTEAFAIMERNPTSPMQYRLCKCNWRWGDILRSCHHMGICSSYALHERKLLTAKSCKINTSSYCKSKTLIGCKVISGESESTRSLHLDLSENKRSIQGIKVTSFDCTWVGAYYNVPVLLVHVLKSDCTIRFDLDKSDLKMSNTRLAKRFYPLITVSS